MPFRADSRQKCKATSELVDPSQLTKRPSGISAFDTLKEKNAAIGLAPKATGQIKERQKTTNASEKTKPETAAKDVPSKPDVPVQSKPKPKEATTDVSSKPTTGSKPKPEDDAKDKAIKVARLVDNLPSKAPVADDSAKVAPSKPAVLTDSKTKANGAQSGVNKGAKGDSCSSHDESLGRLYDKKTPNAMPKGLSNFSLACFGNAPMQCLSGVAELVEHYQEQADNTIVEIADLVKQHPDFDRPGKGSRNINKLRNEVKSLLTIHEDLM